MSALGILGGTFDPPHIGHVILASEAQDQLHLDKILWVMTPLPPHKSSTIISSMSIRKDLLQAAIADNIYFEYSPVDVERDPPYYAVDTMRILRDQYPDDDLIYLMGEDSLRDLPKWHLPVEFLSLCNGLGVMRRAGVHANLSGLSIQLSGIEQKTRYIDVPILEISSSDIRRRVRNGKPFRYFLPEKVTQLVIEHKLYTSDHFKNV